MPLSEIMRVYAGSDGEATKALFAELEAIGAAGVIALNVFRAVKNSERAKLYRRGRFKHAAYDRKQWAMDNLCKALAENAQAITWGWGVDEKQPYHRDVLYVDLPTGQVSFHTAGRGDGPDYVGAWDGVRGVGPERICKWVSALLCGEEIAPVAIAPAPRLTVMPTEQLALCLS
jgi:hypothetical protein